MQEEMGRLENELSLLARALAYPPVPPLAAAVRRRLEAARAQAMEPARPWALAGVAIAVAVVLAAAFLGSIAPARDAVADLFDRISIFQAQEIPAGLPRDITGEEVTLAQAQRRLGRPLALPSYPDRVESSLQRVLYQEFPPSTLKVVVLFFAPEGYPPFVLFQTNGSVTKGIEQGGLAERVEGLGEAAYWLEGLRVVQFYDPEGRFVRESQRAADTNTLVWVQGGFVLRLEGDLPREEAVRIAKSLQ